MKIIDRMLIHNKLIDNIKLLNNSMLLNAISVVNALVYVLFSIEIFITANYSANSTIKAIFLVMAILLDVYGFCIYEDMKMWYGINAVIASFLLFAIKDYIVITLVFMGMIMIPIIYTPTKELVKGCTEMLFAYGFLLSNMSLITGYVDTLGYLPDYDLGASVYLELALALVGIVYCHMWDKYKLDNTDGKEIIYPLRGFYKVLLLVVVAAFIVIERNYLS